MLAFALLATYGMPYGGARLIAVSIDPVPSRANGSLEAREETTHWAGKIDNDLNCRKSNLFGNRRPLSP